jgi:hypothetical protein
LGNALREEGARVKGVKAIGFLTESVTAYHSALEVYTREVFQFYHERVEQNLGKAEELLQNGSW